MVADALRRQRDAEEVAHQAKLDRDAEQKRRLEVEAKLAEVRNNAVKIQSNEVDQIFEKLNQEADDSMKVLKNARLQQKQRLHAFVIMTNFLKKKVVPMLQKKVVTRATTEIRIWLRGKVRKQSEAKYKKALLLLQRMVRGLLGRRRVKLLKRQQGAAGDCQVR